MARSATLNASGATPAMAQWFADQGRRIRTRCCSSAWATSTSCSSPTRRPPPAALDIALTQRGEHNGAPIPMCGVPEHAAEAYLARLIRRGFRVAVASRWKIPSSRTGKAPIRREVVRLITPGTLTEEALLDAGRPNLLLALARGPADGWSGVARRLDRLVRDRGDRRGRPARPARPARPGRDPGASRARARRLVGDRAAPGRHAAAA